MRYICLILFVVFIVFPTISYPQATGTADVEVPRFKGSEKIGLSLKKEWQKSMCKGELDTKVRVMVKYNVRSTHDAVRTTSIEIGELPLITRDKDVQYIDIGKRMLLR